ncbi:hypothetical protein TNCV_4288401 [Trichonephila clavipes]|nr:hypothetical protein TNCV_4288401 [Trichonephila clavipes]
MRVNINVAIFSYSRAFGDGPSNFEQWSNDETPELATPSPNFHTSPTEGRLSLGRFNLILQGPNVLKMYFKYNS